ncbi:MAG: sulfatase, partial [Planctomycetota bacterium]
ATPNIDRIAGEGTLFENAYCSHPICCPSRANMWSGRYTHNCESWNNHKGLEPGMWSLLDELPGTHELQTLGKLDYRSGGHTIQARLTAWLGAAGIDKPQYDEDNSQCFSVADTDEYRCHEGDWELVDRAVEFLERQKEAQQQGGRPFFLTLSSGLVHAAFHTNRHWLEKIPAEDVDIPPMDDTDHPCQVFQRMAKAWRYGFDEDTVRRVRRIYFAMCAECDAMVGALYDAMQRLGLADNTYFVFSGDHGELALEHQNWYKMSLYEGSVRVPMVMTGPDLARGQRCENIVSLIDMCPTFMEMAGLEERDEFDGESLMPLARGDTTESRDLAYACHTGTALNTSAYMLRKGRWKYTAYAGYPPQLFDLDSDPEELNDLCGERPEVADRLHEELEEIVDIEETHTTLMDYNKNAFRQFRRQAKKGLYVDDSYGLRDNPSSDYMTIMDNAFSGYDETDEERVKKWLDE